MSVTSEQVRDLAEQFFYDVFLGYLTSMRTGANAKRMESGERQVWRSVVKPPISSS